jgi:tetratricopeptide (TPR) repeat protein
LRRFLILLVFSSVLPACAQESSSTQATQPAPTQAEAPSPELSRAESAILKSDWKTAEPILNAWIAGHPQDARALFDAGYAADAQRRDEDAAGLYRRALQANPNSFEAQVSLGLLLARTGRDADARPALEAATRLDAVDAGPAAKARAWRALAQLEMRAGEHGGTVDAAQASIDLLEALKLSPETPADTLMAARLAEANDDPTGAEAAYRRLLKADAKQPDAQAGLAHLLIAEKKYPDAEELLQAALKNNPDDPALTAQLAAVFVAEDKADALPLLQQFHQKHPQDNAITRMLAQVEADAGEYDESDRLYLALLAASPRDSGLLAGHGQNLIRLRRYPEAMKAFETATAIDETNGEAWNGLAFAAFETHQPAVTLHALSMRSKYLPENATILFLWATAYDTLHDKKQAVAYYHKFLDSAAGKLPDQEWQARQRLALMEKTP